MTDRPIEHLDLRGYYHKGLFDIINNLASNWADTLTKLDADTGDTTFNTDHAVTSPSIGTTYDVDISPIAMPQGKVNQLLKNLRAEFNDAMDAVAADDGIDGTTVYTNLKFSTTALLVDAPDAGVKLLGEHQGDLVTFLDNFVEKFNNFLKELDADSQLTDTDYASTHFVTDYVEDSSSSSSSRSSSSSSSSSLSSSSSSSSSSRSSSSSSSSRSSSSSSSRSSSSSSSSSLSSSSSSSSRSSSSSSRSSSSSSSSSRSSSSSSSSRSSSSSSSSSSSQSVS